MRTQENARARKIPMAMIHAVHFDNVLPLYTHASRVHGAHIRRGIRLYWQFNVCCRRALQVEHIPFLRDPYILYMDHVRADAFRRSFWRSFDWAECVWDGCLS